jgi:hypothetical protein
MKSINSSRLANYLVAAVLVLVPFHAFLTVWGSALIGHYTALRLWDDAVLLILFCIAGVWLAKDLALRRWFTGSLLVRLILTYTALTFLLGFVSWLKGDVTPKALFYGLLVNLRLFAWFLCVLLAAQRSPWLRRTWSKLLLIPAVIVVAFAVLQYTVLPHDFLSHFGYSAATNIAPTETINHNPHYIRVQSTLRGANPLGAYLVLILSVLGALYARGKRKLVCAVSGASALLALYASGSRSAWIGAVIVLAVIAWSWLRSPRAKLIFLSGTVIAIALASVGYLVLQNNVGVQNAVLHTQTHSAVSKTSNEAHVSAFKQGVQDLWRQPLGDGPGTAGPASVYNHGHSARIAENYYVQIAQETGWLGLALFITIVVLIAMELYGQISRSRLAFALFASLLGLAFVNLLSHAWVDDTLAYLWWGLAGIALARPLPKRPKGKREVQN